MTVKRNLPAIPINYYESLEYRLTFWGMVMHYHAMYNSAIIDNEVALRKWLDEGGIEKDESGDLMKNEKSSKKFKWDSQK